MEPFPRDVVLKTFRNRPKFSNFRQQLLLKYYHCTQCKQDTNIANQYTFRAADAPPSLKSRLRLKSESLYSSAWYSMDNLERATDLGPQAISIIASITAGCSSILVVQLTNRFPLSFHASSPRWKYTIWPVLGYFLVYLALLTYGVLASIGVITSSDLSISKTLAFMAAPGVPLHGFLWALVPQVRHAPDPPATDAYIFQTFRRKPAILLFITWLPLVASAVLAGVWRVWQALAVQLATTVAFLATGRTPETMPRARESAFGRAGRYLMLPRPGRRNDTLAYGVDLQKEILLEPVRVTMGGTEAYRIVSELKFGRLGRESDDETTSEVPVGTYLDSLVSNFPRERISDMTGRLWRSLEAWKERVTEPAKELPLMYGLCERMTYVAYRPGSCSTEERGVATMLNFVNCRADCERVGAENQANAQILRANWRREGELLAGGEYWANARASGENPVDKNIPPGEQLLEELRSNNFQAQDIVESVGAVVYFLKHVFGHNEQVLESIVRNVPFYYNRIREDLTVQGSIPVVCHGIMFSMKKKGMIAENVLGHEWAATEGVLRWAGGGYAILDQAYARNSAIAYVGQLTIIVVKAVIEN